jgi:hypothetical protein
MTTQAQLDEVRRRVRSLNGGGKVLVCGCRGSNFTPEWRDDPRFVFWDQSDIRQIRSIPSGVRLVLLTKFIRHDLRRQIQKLLPSGVEFVNLPLGTGQLKQLISPHGIDPEVMRRVVSLEVDPSQDPGEQLGRVLKAFRRNRVNVDRATVEEEVRRQVAALRVAELREAAAEVGGEKEVTEMSQAAEQPVMVEGGRAGEPAPEPKVEAQPEPEERRVVSIMDFVRLHHEPASRKRDGEELDRLCALASSEGLNVTRGTIAASLSKVRKEREEEEAAKPPEAEEGGTEQQRAESIAVPPPDPTPPWEGGEAPWREQMSELKEYLEVGVLEIERIVADFSRLQAENEALRKENAVLRRRLKGAR